MSRCILIVEDEAILADALAAYLQRHTYTVMVAYSGEDGLRLAGEHRPDVAVVDMRLPGIDGLEVLRRVREMSPRTVVVMMSAYLSMAGSGEVTLQGAFACLSKPLDLEACRRVIDTALAHGGR